MVGSTQWVLDPPRFLELAPLKVSSATDQWPKRSLQEELPLPPTSDSSSIWFVGFKDLIPCLPAVFFCKRVNTTSVYLTKGAHSHH